MEYNPTSIEPKWRSFWKEDQTYKVDNKSSKPKFYILDMFPYPSGAGLHVGHPLGYIASDIYSRYKRMSGFNVLHPMGFDAFGLPAEEYALQTGIHPAVSTKKNMVRYKDQLSKLGFSFDWNREIATCNPNYYKWTQWIFTQLFDHYYDQESKKAKPIQDLVEHFKLHGNKDFPAKDSEISFDAASWNDMNAKEQSEALMEYRLAYRKVGYVNWCEALGTVLANDQVKDGVSERGAHPVEQKAMTQWYLRITDYAERLLGDLDDIEWSDSLKTIQRNWIGRSEGASIAFDIVGSDEKIEVFTTRPDTIFGATYMVLAPEHDLVAGLISSDQKQEVEKYISYVKAKSELERMAEKTVTGAFLGSYAMNPFTNEKIPIWIGEYVLKDYGTGAIMAVPSDDDRDNTFAKKFGLAIIDVVDKSNYPGATLSDKLGIIINSGFMNGMEVPQAISAACDKVEDMGIGQKKINYKLRDANFSRQRYWGEPFPIKYDKDGIPSALTLDELPLELPDTDDFKPGGGGKSPLSRISSWINHEDGYHREPDVMPAVAGSSWYYLRYMDPQNENAFASQDAVNYWQSVDLYVGGSEHAVAHLMYARFWHKFLFDKGMVPTNEPFKKLINQGMIQGVIEYIYLLREKKDGYNQFICSQLLKERNLTDADLVRIPIHIDYVKEYGSSQSYINIQSIEQFISWRPAYKDAMFHCSKGTYHKGRFTSKGDHTDSHLFTHSEVGKMSKSKFNVINPDEVIDKYGTDCFRMYEMFLGPVEQSKPWDTQGIDGVFKFLRKFWSLYVNEDGSLNLVDGNPSKDEMKILHTCIKNVSRDVLRFSFNTCVSHFMICTNELKKLSTNCEEVLEPLLRLLAPFAPHLVEELWQRMGNKVSIHRGMFPIHDEKFLAEESVDYPICINGKKRGMHSFATTMSKDEIEKVARSLEVVTKWTEGKSVRKVIVVPNRMVNIVVG